MNLEKKEKTFVVSLKGLGPWISSIRYEKDKNDVKLYVTLAKETLPAEQAGRPAVIVEDTKLGGKLSERMFQNLEYHQSSSLYMSTLSPQDFADCNANLTHLKNCLADLKNSALDVSFLLVAQLQGKEPQGFLWTHRDDVKKRITQQFRGTAKENWVVFHVPGNSPDAKSRILSLVR